MKLLPKIEYVKRWFLKGYTLTRMQCIAKWGYMNLPDAVYILNKRGWDIENLHKKPKYGKYKLKS